MLKHMLLLELQLAQLTQHVLDCRFADAAHCTDV